jgi:hypothetical protein
VASLTIWHGDTAGALALQVAVEHNCTCEVDANGRTRPGKCSAHRAMLDQRFVDGILFGRYLTEQLLREEFLLSTPRE